MNQSDKDQFTTYYDDCLTILNKIHETVSPKCIDISKKWRLKDVLDDSMDQLYEQSKKEFNLIQPKITRKEMECIFIGDTSAGKSSLINAILRRNDLPCKTGKVTNCFVNIQATLTEGHHLKINEEETALDKLNVLINAKHPDHLPPETRVDLLYNIAECPFLKDNVVIRDTPGIDKSPEISEKVVKACGNADLIVLVINATTGFNNNIKIFLNKYKTEFSDFNYFVVFNHWDICTKEDDCEDSKRQLREELDDVFIKSLQFSKIPEDRVFYLSAVENIVRHNGNGNESPEGNMTNDFRIFAEELKKAMSAYSIQKKDFYCDTLLKIVTRNFQKCQNIYNQMKVVLSTKANALTDKLDILKDLEGEIRRLISLIYPLAYNRFFEETLRTIENKFTEEEKAKYMHDKRTNKTKANQMSSNDKECIDSSDKAKLIKTSESDITEEDIKTLKEERMKKIVEIIVTESKRDLQNKIHVLIRQNNDEQVANLIVVIDEIYSPYYFDIIDRPIKDDWIDNFSTIKTKIIFSMGSTIAASAVTVAGGLATGGVSFVIMGAIEIATLTTAGIGFGGALVGATLGGGISTGIIKRIKQPFKRFWRSDEEPIHNSWICYQDRLNDSYPEFLKDLRNFISIKDQLKDIETEIDKLRNVRVAIPCVDSMP